MGDIERLYHEAITLFRSGDLNLAVFHLERVLTLDSTHLDALEALGVLYAKLDRLDEAIEVMQRLVKASPNHVMAHTNLSRFYIQKGMVLEAEREQAEARRLSWKAELQAQKKENLSLQKSPQELAREEKAELENRISRYQKVIELDPQDVLGYFSLGTAYMDANRLEEARSAFEKALTVDSRHSPSYFSLGVILESLARRKEAVKIYEQGIKVADAKGDMIPLRKMEARLNVLRQESA